MSSQVAIFILGVGAVVVTLGVVGLSVGRRFRRPAAPLNERLMAAGPDVRSPRSRRGPRTPLVADLTNMATDALGNRSRKVNEILLDSEPTTDALLMAVDQIPKLSLLFVESERLDKLAGEMRAKIRSNPTAET